MTHNAEKDAVCPTCGHSGLYCETTPRGCCRDCGHRAENDAPGVLCAACYLTLTQAGFNPCDHSAPSCPPTPIPPGGSDA